MNHISDSGDISDLVTARGKDGRDFRRRMRVLHLERLGRVAEQRRALQRELDDSLETLGPHVAGARAAGAPMAEIARTCDLPRASVYDLMRRYMGTDGHLEFRILSAIAGHGGLALDQLAAAVGFDGQAARMHVDQLVSLGALQRASAGHAGANSTVTYLFLTARGEDRLEALAESIGGQVEARYLAYVAVGWEEKDALADMASKRFGALNYALIEPDVGSSAQPELAFRLRGQSPEEALARTRQVLAELRDCAGVPHREVGQVALIPDFAS